MSLKTKLAVLCYPISLRAIPIPLPVVDPGAIDHLIQQVNEVKRTVHELNKQLKAVTGKGKIKNVPKEQLNNFLSPE